jgi:hypothetical protein
MMQHCQQVFAELNHGGVSVGGGGVPRTMIAGMGQPQQGYGQPPQQQGYGQPPGMPQNMGYPQQQPQNYGQPAGAQAKTMIAQQSPFAQGGPMQGQMPGGMQGQGMPQQGYQPLGAAQKTIVAGMAPPIMHGQMQPGQHPGQMLPQGTPGGGFPPPQSGPNKTVMLQPSEGVVSVARTGHAVQAATGPIVDGASTLYWIVCLFTGIAVGVLAYVVYLQV